MQELEEHIAENEDYADEAGEKRKETEHGDIFSMLVSAFFTLWLPCVGILILICVLAYVLLGLPFAH